MLHSTTLTILHGTCTEGSAYLVGDVPHEGSLGVQQVLKGGKGEIIVLVVTGERSIVMVMTGTTGDVA